jgi:hypothetical protein
MAIDEVLRDPMPYFETMTAVGNIVAAYHQAFNALCLSLASSSHSSDVFVPVLISVLHVTCIQCSFGFILNVCLGLSGTQQLIRKR